jgi:hypothetical protein
MKRNSLRTGRPYRRGDIRQDGYVFFNYTGTLRSDGYYGERWLSPAASERARVSNAVRMRVRYGH